MYSYSKTDTGTRLDSGILRMLVLSILVCLTVLLIASVCSDGSDAKGYDAIVEDNGISYEIWYEYDSNGLVSDDKAGQACIIDGKNASGELILGPMVNVNGGSYHLLGIESYAFCGNPNITSLTLKTGDRADHTYSSMSIGIGAFNDCTGIQSITFSGGYDFEIESDVSNVLTGNRSLTSRGIGAFDGCTGVKTVTAPIDAECITGFLLRDMTALTALNLEPAADQGSWGRQMVDGILFEGEINTYNDKFTPKSLIYYPQYLTNTELNLTDEKYSKVSGICNYAFNNSKLTKLTLNSARIMGYEVFEGCSSMKTVDFTGYLGDATVKSAIGADKSFTFYPFSKMTGLENLIVNGLTDYVVDSTNKTIRYVPNASSSYFLFCAPGHIAEYKMHAQDGTNIIIPYAFNGVTVDRLIPGWGINEQSLYGLSVKEFAVDEQVKNRYAVENGGLYLASDGKKVQLIKQANLDTAVTDLTVTDIWNVWDYAFQDCTSLKTVTFVKDTRSNTLKVLGANAFEGCTSLTKVTIPADITNYSSDADGRAILMKESGKWTLWKYVANGDSSPYTVPANAVCIGGDTNGVFSSDCRIASITIPANVETIKADSFLCLPELSEVSLPASSIDIQTGAFKGCNKLLSISIPDTVTKLASDAFIPTVKGPITVNVGKDLTNIGSHGFNVRFNVDADNPMYESGFGPVCKYYPIEFIIKGKAIEKDYRTYGSSIYVGLDESNNKYTDPLTGNVLIITKWMKKEGATLTDVTNSSVEVTGPVTLRAIYTETISTWTVTFDPCNGDPVTEVKVNKGTAIDASKIPADPVKAGTSTVQYAFAGWAGFDSAAPVTEDVTYKATYTESYLVKFVSGDEVLASVFVEKGKTVDASKIPADPVKTGTSTVQYAFAGWDGFDSAAPVTQSSTYEATYTESYLVKFVSGDEVLSSVFIEKGQAIAAPADPAKTSGDASVRYVFDGWMDESNSTGYTSGMLADAPHVFTAVFSEEAVAEDPDEPATENPDGKKSFPIELVAAGLVTLVIISLVAVLLYKRRV